MAEVGRDGDPIDAEGWRDLAQPLQDGGRYQELEALYVRALEGPLPGVERAGFALELGYVIFETSDDIDRCLEAVERGLALLQSEADGPQVVLLQGLLRGLEAECNFERGAGAARAAASSALRLLDRYVQEVEPDESVSMAHCQAGRLHLLLGEAEQAIVSCQRGLVSQMESREDLRCRLTLIRALRAARRFDEAREYLVELDGRDVDPGVRNLVDLERGMLERDVGQPQGAIEAYRRLEARLEGRDGSAQPHHVTLSTSVAWSLGELYYEAGDFLAAAARFRRILDLHPDSDEHHGRALLWLGDCHWRMSKFEEAKECYLDVLGAAGASEDDRALARGRLSDLLNPPARET